MSGIFTGKGLLGGGGAFWKDQLRPASWRGVTFGVLLEQEEVTRQLATHQYPYRDEVWVEDLGGGTAPFAVNGFLVGDDAIQQRDALRAAANREGPGDLVHPMRGSMQAVLLSLSIGSKWDAGRVIELSFRFIPYAPRRYPATETDTAQATENAADAADAASESGFLDQIGEAISYGAGVVDQAVSVARDVQSQANALMGDAAAALHAVGSLTGQNYMSGRLGRYFRGARGVMQTSIGQVNTVTGAIGRVNTARATVTQAGATLVTKASLL